MPPKPESNIPITGWFFTDKLQHPHLGSQHQAGPWPGRPSLKAGAVLPKLARPTTLAKLTSAGDGRLHL